ncbi:MAG: acetate/propionate family kinase [Candidatus Nanoarchaeia archaeon]|nr:acetate/propionate family kinase [Candidatus Nanoarchaeia archaeon]MDD5357923.1 acetate/propionate family kinase [Candidatus Nanoarchaeia archaeon]MDD5588842.1 acetate/propionate family kinase [Candidatus Nanoarchaeia archaeon]
MKKILVFNVGSSSIKYSLFEDLDLKDSENFERLKTKEDYSRTVEKIFKKINGDGIDVIAHRVVHGGDLKKPSKINEETKKKIKEFSEFAPLHNPRQLMVIELCEKYKKPQYAVFDTMFFSEIPDAAKIYAIPKEITKKYEIQRYGFHGLSHEYVSRDLKGKTITCHLGSGSSISAILNKKPIDTTMGFTPSEGLIMGTRSGTIDPGIIFFLEKKGYNVQELLTEKSGLKGLTGFSDFRDILSRMNKNKNCRLAYDMLIYQITKIIGSYIAALNGLDNLIFTAKIGENVQKLREDVCRHLSFFGVEMDREKNKLSSEIISSKKSRVKVFVRKTNEEKMAVEKVLKIL